MTVDESIVLVFVRRRAGRCQRMEALRHFVADVVEQRYVYVGHSWYADPRLEAR